MKALKNLYIIALMLLCATNAAAQGKRTFDPMRFEMELEQFIATDACLSPEDASVFFPVYREMRKKLRTYFGSDRNYRHIDPTDDKICAEAIRFRDRNDVEMKHLQQDYHEKFMRLLPASKVYRIIQAEDKFHRRTFENVAKRFKPSDRKHNKVK